MPFLDAAGVQVNFPFDPYACQVDYMDKVIKCLRDGVNGILESPTGTGKTLCLLCSSLAWLEDKKAQISSQRWKMAQQEEGAVEFYKEQLANQLDTAAGSWAGELAAPKIIYASRTHSQLTQAIQELKRTAYRHFKVCVLGSREQLCIHPQVIKEESNSAKVHLCRAKVSARSCHFYNNIEQAKGNFANQVMDIEDLVGMGQKHNCCPYYMSKEMKNEADVIFMPYNYLLDPKSRKAHGVELNGNIIIFDEAHNLEKICEDSSSFDWTSAEIASAIKDLKELSEKLSSQITAEESGASFDMADTDVSVAQDFTLREIYELKAQLHDLEAKIDEIKINKKEGIHKPGHYIFELFGAVNLNFTSKNNVVDLLDKIVTYLTSESTSTFHSKGAGLTKYCDVIKIVFSRDMANDYSSMTSHQQHVAKHYKVHVKENVANTFTSKKKSSSWDTPSNALDAKKGAGRTLSYWCFSPGHTMEELQAAGVRSIILTSGTLSPLESFTTEMGIKFPIQLENPHVIEPHQVWIGIVSKGPDGTILNSSYENRFKESYLSSLGNAVVNFSRIVPQGLLLFFPSYPVMNKCLEHWQEHNMWNRIEQYKPIYVEPRTKTEFQTAMMNFYDRINDQTANGAVFAAVCRGKVSEGLDFADNNGRAVVITGLPFPPRMDPKVVLKMQYLDEMRRNGGKGLTGQAWYRQQASRAVNQAIGRVIRHKEDFGAIILCDNRFGSNESRAQLPIWIRPSVKQYQQFGMAVKDMMGFFKTAEKNLPVPGKAKSRSSSSSSVDPSGCQGACFTPTALSMQQNLVSRLGRSGTIVSHVPSLKPQQPDEFSLAKLKVQYESSEAVEFTQSLNTESHGLLGALSAGTCKPVFGVSGMDLDPSTSGSSLKPQEKNRVKKKIVIKSNRSADNRTEVTTGGLQTAEQYLTEVKKTLSTESYAVFSSTLGEYKKTQDLDKMVANLADIFTTTHHNYHLFRKFYRFVRPQHKESFDRTCREVLGQGCGYKPEDSIQKKRTAQHQGNDEKKRKTDDKNKFSSNTDNKSTEKTSIGSSTGLDSQTHLNTGALSTNSSLSSDSQLSGINGTSLPSNQSNLNAFFGTAASQSQASNQPDVKPNTVDKEQSASATPLAIITTNSGDVTKPKSSCSPDIQKLLESKLSGYKCCHCGKDACVPLKSACTHIGCLECWKKCIRDSKECPTCGVKVKRKHLSRVMFPIPAK